MMCTIGLLLLIIYAHNVSVVAKWMEMIGRISDVKDVPRTMTLPQVAGTMVALHYGAHDANMAIAYDGIIIASMALEDFFCHLPPSLRRGPEFFTRGCTKVLRHLMKIARMEHNVSISLPFDAGVFVEFENIPTFDKLNTTIPCRQWFAVHHHLAHAMSAFGNSPYESALAITVDGGGDSVHHTAYHLCRNGDPRLLYVCPMSNEIDCPWLHAFKWSKDLWPEVAKRDMLQYEAYAQLSTPSTDATTIEMFRQMFKHYFGYKIAKRWDSPAWRKASDVVFRANVLEQQTLVATAHEVWNALIVEHINKSHRVRELIRSVEGIVLAGGMFHNAFIRTSIQRSFGLPIYVTRNPGDAGLAVGALRALQRTKSPRNNARSFGPPLSDLSQLPEYVESHHALKAAAPVVSEWLMQDSLVAVLHGRSSWGTVHLEPGARMVIGAPFVSVRHKLLKYLRAPQWASLPVVMTSTCAHQVFDQEYHDVLGMQLSLPPLSSVCARYAAVCNPNGKLIATLVSAGSHPWLHAVLLSTFLAAGREQMPCPLLFMAPFGESKEHFGTPSKCNTIADSLREFEEQRALDVLWVNGYGFLRDKRNRALPRR